MKKLLTVTAIAVAMSAGHALANGWDYNNNTSQPREQRQGNYNYQQDNWGNYTKRDNLYKDSDNDGVSNRYDYNDRNPNIQRKGQTDYSLPSFNYGAGSGRRK
jgi:hypothetical protein